MILAVLKKINWSAIVGSVLIRENKLMNLIKIKWIL